MIVLLPKNPAQWRALTRRDQSDSDGSFALRSVAPGEYTVIAIEDGWQLDWTSPRGNGALPSRRHKRHSIREIGHADPFELAGDSPDALTRFVGPGVPSD